MTKTFKADIVETLQPHPATAFISQPKEAEAVAVAERKPTPKAERATGNEERKSVRVNLLFKPSVKEAVDKLARFDATSINDLIGKVLTDYIANRKEDIAKIDALRG